MFKIINYVFIGIIKIYQYVISPLFPKSCRFYPTCSAYAVQSFKTHSWFKALWLSITRIGRCHPWHEGGYDPVPNSENSSVKNG